MKHLPDTALLERMQAYNDRAAFDELYHRYWEQLYMAAYARLQQEADAKDCLQEVFVALWHKRRELRIEGPLGPYLHVALKYRVLNHLRSHLNYQKHLDIFSAIPPAIFDRADDRLALAEIQQIIAQTVAALPEKTRQVYILSRQEQLSVREMADQLGVSQQTVKNQLTTALKRLKDALAGFK
ncbi:RNA polymerase sigma-70 factor [Chitinophaga oryzae]|uniref:RNA polymerase sigma-70 factor n=1 Tax=Chitinophaga oryzae TaxID=2725414 RepID=A0ABX6LAT1_9BACT|nr:RNA polymerase sigma-70 factor [Chitinophaga oryzae]QJB37211.1 RNA polymerase sigma-70 factor [Chitinophaga oryzae]